MKSLLKLKDDRVEFISTSRPLCRNRRFFRLPVDRPFGCLYKNKQNPQNNRDTLKNVIATWRKVFRSRTRISNGSPFHINVTFILQKNYWMKTNMCFYSLLFFHLSMGSQPQKTIATLDLLSGAIHYFHLQLGFPHFYTLRSSSSHKLACSNAFWGFRQIASFALSADRPTVFAIVMYSCGLRNSTGSSGFLRSKSNSVTTLKIKCYFRARTAEAAEKLQRERGETSDLHHKQMLLKSTPR